MKVSSLTLNIAWQISSDRFQLNLFYKHAAPGQFIYFTHTAFLYSYPAFGKTWPGNKYYQFHLVITCCHICGQLTDRNYGGYGTMILQRTGLGNRMNLVCTEHNFNTEFTSRLFCKKQLSLF